LIETHSDHIENLAKELLQKETLDLLDILRILGERPFPASDSMKDYLKEVQKSKDENKLLNEEKKKENEDEESKDDKNDKDDEFEKDKDLKGKDGSGGSLPPKDSQERDIRDAETIMKH